MEALKIFETQDGSHSIFAEQFGVSYHSKYGAIQETQHVFIDAALRFKAVEQQEIRILEMGFGTGLNAYMTYLEAQKRNLRIRYTGVEAYPVTQEQWQQLNYEEALDVPSGDKGIFEGLHSAAWNTSHQINEHFTFTKLSTRFEVLQLERSFDVIYYDTFAPNAQPELWEESLFQKMYDALLDDGILVTYCAKGAVKRTMKSVGFEVERLKGPPGKREMTRAIRR
ncbi:MAG: tRNA (5-methylaminomethyl-2-thiouridine)(34)-methyltransferase MnmD [Bacteroidota bacterium]